MSEAPMLIVGLMSGTSLDGMDAALVQIAGPANIKLLAFIHRPYSQTERAQIESVLAHGGVAETARLHAAIGDWACEAVDLVLHTGHERADHLGAICFSGQTIWHEPPIVTWQLGDASKLAERFAVKVVHDLRSRDVAAGGQGAPLVPMVDGLCFAAVEAPRILVNIGGMANATWVPAHGDLEAVVAGDTGPGMAIIDAVAHLVSPAQSIDRDGELARAGVVDQTVLAELLADSFFRAPMPRSTGREHFGVDYAMQLHNRAPGVNGVRTAVALTAATIVQFCTDHLPAARDVVISGGGVHHPILMSTLTELFAKQEMTVHRFDELFFSGDAKEAVAFALLGWLTLHGQPGNLPRVTGAEGARVLGSVVPA